MRRSTTCRAGRLPSSSVQAMILSFGLCTLSHGCVGALDGELEDSTEKLVQAVIEGGGSNPDPIDPGPDDPGPDDPGTDPEPPVDNPGDIVPLFDGSTRLEAATVVDTGSALITRFADRGRDRHARESVFASYE